MSIGWWDSSNELKNPIHYMLDVEERSPQSRRDQTKFHPTSPVPPPSRINEADVFQIREVTNAFFVRMPRGHTNAHLFQCVPRSYQLLGVAALGQSPVDISEFGIAKKTLLLGIWNSNIWSCIFTFLSWRMNFIKLKTHEKTKRDLKLFVKKRENDFTLSIWCVCS